MHSSIPRLAVIAALASFGAAACETTAYIVPENKSLSFIESVGSMPTICDPATPELSHSLRFTAISTDGERIRPGDELVGFTVDLGDTFAIQDVTIQQSEGRLYPVPNVECASPADCVAAGLPADFACESLDETGEVNVSNPTVCSRPLSVQIDPNQPLGYIPAESDAEVDRHVMVLMSRGSTLLGQNPLSLVNDDIPQRIEITWSSDFEQARTAALTQFMSSLVDEDDENPYDVNFCFATYVNDAEFLNEANCFEQLEQDDINLIATQITTAAQPDPGDLQTPFAMLTAISRLAQQPEGEKHLVLFTDAPTVTQSAQDTMDLLNATYARVAEQAAQFGVTVHVIQLDNPFQGRDVNGDGIIDAATGDEPAFWPRTGPIPELQDVACQTGGTFQYAQSPSDLAGMFDRLGRSLIEYYEATVSFNSFGAPAFGSYMVSFNLDVSLNDRTEVYVMRAGAPDPQGRADRRTVFPFFGGCNDERPCLGLLTCNPDNSRCELPLIEELVTAEETTEE